MADKKKYDLDTIITCALLIILLLVILGYFVAMAYSLITYGDTPRDQLPGWVVWLWR